MHHRRGHRQGRNRVDRHVCGDARGRARRFLTVNQAPGPDASNDAATFAVGGWDATVLVCDAAQVADGKLYVLGGGWSLCGPGPFVHSLAVKIDVPWDQANRKHALTARLVNEDGAPVALGDPPQELRFESEFEVGRPPGMVEGTPLIVPFAIGLGPIDLPADAGYSWIVEIDGSEIARTSFRTRPSR